VFACKIFQTASCFLTFNIILRSWSYVTGNYCQFVTVVCKHEVHRKRQDFDQKFAGTECACWCSCILFY